jgi:predicted GNAT family N-acyltransferase
MPPDIYCAETDEDRNAIFRFRYHVYVEEMNRYGSIADHENKLLIEEDDAHSRLYAVTDDGDLVGAMRFTWGADAPFSARHIRQYDLAPFLEDIPPGQMIVGERFMVARAYRGSDLLSRMFRAYLNFVNEHRIQLIFGDCEPHLLNLYQGMGFQTYTKNNVNSPETGYLIPLVMVPEDIAYMKAIKSPLLSVLSDFGADSRVPESVPRLLAEGSAVISQRLVSKDDYWADVQNALNHLEANRVSLFDDLSEDQAQECLAKSNVIECHDGDHVIKRGNVAQNMFVVLSGTLEVRDGDRVIAVVLPGDVFGEMAFLLGNPRSMDVFAASDDVRVLSLSESTIRKLIESNPQAAAKLLLNISKMLCHKILRNT